MPTVTFNASSSWTAPSDIAGPPQVQCWGESGTGGISAHGSNAGAGSGGGAYGEEPAYAGVTAGTVLTITIGAGATGTDTTVTGGTGTVTAAHGTSASGAAQGTGGAAGSNTIAFKGGDGAAGAGGASAGGSGGGGSAGQTGAGGNASGSTGGTAGSGGGQAGASGAGASSNGAAGTAPGGGASGGGSGGSFNHSGGTAAAGRVIITWTTISYAATGYASVTARAATAKKASSGVKGYFSFAGGPLPVRAVNQWSATFAQPASVQNTPPALQSSVIALTPGNSVGGGSGTPTAGNWLFCLTGMTEQSASAGFTAGDSDDIHSFWRPGNVTTSQWAVSTAAGKTRTSVWYTANLARQPADVYAAPNGAMAGMACLVIEVAGIGPWDTVTGITTGYAAAATSLNLAMSAPSAASCVIAAFTGDSTAATQAFAPGNPWQVLSTVSATNGSDHTCDAVLNSALLGATSSSVSVTATAGSATDLSGVLIAVQLNAASPVPGGANPAWPGRFIIEAAFGSGFQTPADQMTWTTLNDNGVAATQATKRGWSWRDSGGVPYALGQLQSGEGAVQLDNADGHLTPSNSASPYYPDVVTGTPIRLRCALGTITDRQAGNVTVNRWYVVQRNILDIPERRNDAWRNFVEMSLTDIWSVAAAAGPTPYRGEIEQDSPYAWYPGDDAPLTGGTLPSVMRNAATGNVNPLNIIISPNGTGPDTGYGTDGTSAGVYGYTTGVPVGLATYNVAQNSGWMFGDPQSGLQSSQSGNPVTASPGSASWQQIGASGNTGAKGFMLTCNDAGFPPLSAGITVEGWFNFPYFGSQKSFSQAGIHVFAQEPYCPLTLMTLTTGSAPAALLQLDTSGHLSLVTYNGTTPTSHSIYSSSDLRTGGWFHVAAALTQGAYRVWVNAGLTADVSGSATISASAWTWLVLNGDMGNSAGGGTTASIEHGANLSWAHVAIYPTRLPAWRIRAHYWAAVTAFGQVPAPSGLALQIVSTSGGASTLWPDGQQGNGTFGLSNTAFTFSVRVVAEIGSYTSGPTSWSVAGAAGSGSVLFGYVVSPSWSGLAPEYAVYTAASVGVETQASVTAGLADVYTSGYGGSAAGAGIGHLSGGSGASPPAAASSVGDTVAQRIERVLGSGGITAPNRSVDSTASELVQAAIDVGGQAVGANVQNMQQSDNGMLFIDNGGALSYRSRPHLAGDAVVWALSSAGPAYGYPYQPSQQFGNDPQKLVNAIDVTPYSPDGSTLPVITPTNATAVAASQLQYGPKPLQVTSYLQSAASQQAQANWIFDQYGTLHRRVAALTVDAAGYPPAWLLVLGANVGDLIEVFDQPMLGGPLSTGTYRISSLSRSIAFGANGNKPQASISIIADFEPSDYWG